MKSVPSAKRLTFFYFSIVAVALVTIHATVFELTTEDIEHLYAENRLKANETFALRVLADADLTGLDKVELPTEELSDVNTPPVIYLNWQHLPAAFPDPDTMKLNVPREVKFEAGQGDNAYFMKLIELPAGGKTYRALLVIDNTLYEFSEEQLPGAHAKQLAISLTLLVISLFVVMKIADRLTRPISRFANTLADRSPDDLEPVAVPEGTATRELLKMVETFNDYQARIRDLLERERAFNRYTSHELRTPLMVMKGAITLLGESKDEAFIEKQRQRLEKATGEISEFIETLLSLTKAVEGAELIPRILSEDEVQNVVANHQYLLNNKPVEWWVKVEGCPVVCMPEAAFHILLGNVVKNAFACVEQGTVSVVVNEAGIRVCDTGPGLYGKSAASEGFGLGLLLVRDICHRYGWSFELKDNGSSDTTGALASGCTAIIGFTSSGLG